MSYNLSVRSNLIQVLIYLIYLLWSFFYYTNFVFDLIGVISLLLIGLLFFVKVDEKYVNLLINAEVLVSPIEYFYLTGKIYLLILPYLIYLLGYISKKVNLSYLLIFLVLATSLLPITTYFGTDEIIIAYYSDHLLLQGLNPYNPNLTSNVFSVYPENVSVCGTPYTTGGVVTNLNYPALYILIYLPSYLLRISPNYIVFLFYLLTPLFFYFRKREIFPLFISGYMVSAYYLTYSTHGIDDIIWVFFLLLSFTSNDIWKKGVFYGLAVSYKQDPLIFLPFYLILLEKKSYKFLLFAVLTFLIINGYFIFLSPYYFFKDITTPVTANIIQIGNGVDVLSVVGLFYEYPLFYTLSELLILFLGIYLSWKSRLKFESIGFVYYVMLFMYRMLFNYISYLPLFTYIGEEKNEIRIGKEIVAVSTIILFALAMFFHYDFSQYYTSLHIEVIKTFEEDGKVYAILLNVSFLGKGEIKPYFRIFSSGGLYTGNGLLWNSNSTWIKSGESEIVLVYTNSSYLVFRDNSFTIINAYYGEYNAYYEVN